MEEESALVSCFEIHNSTNQIEIQKSTSIGSFWIVSGSAFVDFFALDCCSVRYIALDMKGFSIYMSLEVYFSVGLQVR